MSRKLGESIIGVGGTVFFKQILQRSRRFIPAHTIVLIFDSQIQRKTEKRRLLISGLLWFKVLRHLLGKELTQTESSLKESISLLT